VHFSKCNGVCCTLCDMQLGHSTAQHKLRVQAHNRQARQALAAAVGVDLPSVICSVACPLVPARVSAHCSISHQPLPAPSSNQPHVGQQYALRSSSKGHVLLILTSQLKQCTLPCTCAAQPTQLRLWRLQLLCRPSIASRKPTRLQVAMPSMQHVSGL